jgi:hypothetical protein
VDHAPAAHRAHNLHSETNCFLLNMGIKIQGPGSITQVIEPWSKAKAALFALRFDKLQGSNLSKCALYNGLE